MSALPAAPTPAFDLADLQLPIPVQPRPPRPHRVRAWFRDHGTDIALLAPLLALAGTVQAVGMDRSPAFSDVESRLVVAAAGTDRPGWPALGWLPISAWDRLTGAFDRVDHAVLAGREAMVVVTVISAALLWALARRLGLPRVAAVVAVLIYAVSPLAVHIHRLASGDHPAMMWTLAALVLATARRRQVVASALAGVASVFAALAQPTFLVLTPFVVWIMWDRTHSRMRRRALAATGAVLAMGGYAYILIAVVGREPEPGAEDPALWWSLDPVLFVAAAVAALGALAIRELRPVGGALALMFAFLALPSPSTPVAPMVAAVALASGVIPAAVHRLVVLLRERRGEHDAVPLTIMSATAVTVVTVAAAVTWPGGLRELAGTDRNDAIGDVAGWLEANLPPGSRLIADRTLWVDLGGDGSAAGAVVPFDEFAVEPELQPAIGSAPEPAAGVGQDGTWRTFDYIVVTPALRADETDRPAIERALSESSLVAAFGADGRRIEIRQIHPAGLAAAEERFDADRRATRYAADQLLRNDALHFAGDAATVVRDGMVDPRIVLVLGQLAGVRELTVSLPPVPGEHDGPRRRLTLSDIGTDDEAARLGLWLLGQQEPFTPSGVEVDGGDVVATYPLPAPHGLLPDSPEIDN
ncbi:glycosyltransferase family 39 protein [Jiangella asiatica]|uniref:Glycosyltransferase RgtA/B/C/D-like domain-containing protein n=1 Tax=Jiangella asiatica TaxID=2530372 RepID=A0A4R5D5W4_9ACTN|nr:glycosyltransferase family 39 protein [Jiangella asiatica]TDE08872.1 hypothetical protein E1269_15680 [Jiangella asiatica]